MEDFHLDLVFSSQRCDSDDTAQAPLRANVYDIIRLVLVRYRDPQFLALQLSPPCAPRSFPSEYGLLFRTPGIANGTLLACLM